MGVAQGRKGRQSRREREGSWTAVKRAEVCAKLAETCNVRASCRAVGMSEPGFYKLRRRDAAFRAECDRAIAEAYFEIELLMLQRQKVGVKRPVFHGGKKVGTVTHYSDAVALALLRAHRDKADRSGDAERLRREEEDAAFRELEDKLGEMNRRMGGDG